MAAAVAVAQAALTTCPPRNTSAPPSNGRQGGSRPKKPTPKPNAEDGNQCNQGVLDAAHAVQDFADSLNDRSNDMLVIAGVAAATGVPLAATGVGAPGGAAFEITAGGIAGVAVTGKAISGFLDYSGDLVARVETGTQRGFASSLFSAATTLIPASGIAQNIIQDQVNDAASAMVNSEAPRSCPGK